MGDFRSFNAISSTRKSLSAEEPLERFFFLRNSELHGSYMHLVRGRGGAIVGEKEGNKNEREVREVVAYCTNWTIE